MIDIGCIHAGKIAFTVALFSCSTVVQAQNADDKQITSPAIESACAIHIENDYNIKLRLDEIDCAAGDSLLIYNYSSVAKWEVVLPVRVAAAMVCDMSKTITDIGSVGIKPYQSVICTYSGKVRRFKSNDENLKGWGQMF